MELHNKLLYVSVLYMTCYIKHKLIRKIQQFFYLQLILFMINFVNIKILIIWKLAIDADISSSFFMFIAVKTFHSCCFSARLQHLPSFAFKSFRSQFRQRIAFYLLREPHTKSRNLACSSSCSQCVDSNVLPCLPYPACLLACLPASRKTALSVWAPLVFPHWVLLRGHTIMVQMLVRHD